jgi:hypothetical protein
MIKHKLEGPPSKVRVQSPQEKAFVLLQASIGQVHIEEYALRKEMGAMVDYASRFLSATEEYSVRAGRNGHVIVQALKFRLALATNLLVRSKWCFGTIQ